MANGRVWHYGRMPPLFRQAGEIPTPVRVWGTVRRRAGADARKEEEMAEIERRHKQTAEILAVKLNHYWAKSAEFEGDFGDYIRTIAQALADAEAEGERRGRKELWSDLVTNYIERHGTPKGAP